MMKLLMGTHAEVREFLLHYLEGDLPVLKRLQFAMHLIMCRGCLEYLRRYRDSMALAQAYLDDPPPEELVEITLRYMEDRRSTLPGDPEHAGR
jgi:hypothetical protein